MADSKRDLMRQGSRTERAKLTDENRQDMREKMVGPESRTRRALFVLDVEDVEWLDDAVTTLKRKRRKTSRSQLVRLGVSLLRGMSQEDIEALVRDFE
jgi:hypothetical protein